MAIDLKALVKDKKVLAVAGAGAALGAFSLYKKRSGAAGGTASNSAATTTSGTGYTPGSLGSYDSSATDAYNNIQTSVDNQLGTFQNQLTQIQDQLSKVSTPVATGGTTSNTSTSLAPGYGWFATGGKTYTVDSIAKRYGITSQALVSLNPSLQGKSVVPINTPVKVRNNAAPWSLSAYRSVNHLS